MKYNFLKIFIKKIELKTLNTDLQLFCNIINTFIKSFV